MAFVGAASFENVGKARALCMGRVLLSTAFFATTTLSVTLSTADDFTGAPLIRRLAPHHRRFGPRRASPVPTSTFRPFHSLYPGGSFGAAGPRASRLRRDTLGSAPARPPKGLGSRGGRIRVMLRTGRSLPPMRLSTLRFDARRFHPTPAVCYQAPWRLPGPDFHRLADASLRLRDHLPILTTSFSDRVPTGHAVNFQHLLFIPTPA